MQNKNINFVRVFPIIKWQNLPELPNNFFSPLRSCQHGVNYISPLIFRAWGLLCCSLMRLQPLWQCAGCVRPALSRVLWSTFLWLHGHSRFIFTFHLVFLFPQSLGKFVSFQRDFQPKLGGRCYCLAVSWPQNSAVLGSWCLWSKLGFFTCILHVPLWFYM